MKYQHVCLESIGYLLPEEVISSEEIERRLAPLYRRLRLPEGRLELMSGIRERRVWAPGTLPSDRSAEAARLAIAAAGVPLHQVRALVHGSVCRDHLEPATACRVHHLLGLPRAAVLFDTSNACLGLMNGLLQVADMIELGHVSAGVVTGTESSRSLLETTIDQMNARKSLTRETIKPWLASLTIGSASAAFVLVHRSLSQHGTRVLGAVAEANTQHHELCQSGADEAVATGMAPLMDTDAETLMQEGIATGVCAFHRFLEELQWDRSQVHRTICHQVGKAHRRLMLESLGLPQSQDFACFETLGNTGSAALPVTLALAAEQGFLTPGQNVALLGIGSGINSIMVGVDWRGVPVRSA